MAGDQCKPKVMVLGTYHMANPGLDLVMSRIRDTMSPSRQTEIEMLEARLLRFEPTKIAVEAQPEGRLLERYDAYLKGRISLSPNEIEQVGFRLAKSLKHSEVYGVDYDGEMDFDKLEQFAQAENLAWFLEILERLPREMAAKMEAIDHKYTVSQILAIYNSPGMLRYSHALYIDMLRVNAGDRYPGVDVVAKWYRRNMIIYANVRRIVASPRDRVLLIYGAGHAKLLGDFVDEAGDLELVDPLEYLPDVPPFELA